VRRLLLLLAFLLGTAHAANPDGLLEPEKAFRMSARALDAQTVEVSFAIADGYYMYRERFAFAAGAGAKLGGGKQWVPWIEKDEFFGEVETYRKSVAIRLPVERADGALDLTVTSQGCADAGVCYIPMDSKAHIVLASGVAQASRDPGPNFVQTLSLASSDLSVVRLFENSLPLVLGGFLLFGLLLAFTRRNPHLQNSNYVVKWRGLGG